MAEPSGGAGSFVRVSVELEVDSVALQGTLDSFSLPDVLRLLAGTGKSGCLRLEGDRGEGNVWVEAGGIVAARAERALEGAPVEEVIFELLRYDNGSFRFAADEKAPHGEEPHEVDHALAQATELLNEWRELEAVVPSLAHQVRIAPELTVDQVTVDAERWKILVAMAKGPSVGELGTMLSQGELAVSRTVSDLVELGVAIVDEPGPAASDEDPQRRERSSSARATGATRRPRPERRAAPEPSELVDAESPSVPTNGQRAQPDRRRDRREKRDRQDRETRAPSSRAPRTPETRARENHRENGADDPAVPVNGQLPRRSRTTGQRPGAAGQGRPPANPFANGGAQPAQAAPSRAPVPQPTSTSGGLAGLPPFDNQDMGAGLAGGSLDTGLLGPSPLPSDTGQVPMVAASSLPPDLSWAAEDDDAPLGGPGLVGSGRSPMSPPMGTPPPVPPAPPSAHPQLMNTGRSPLATPDHHDEPMGHHSAPPSRGSSVGMVGDGETAAHVAVMSPDARHAVESIIGPSGGGSGVVPAAGASPEESNQRGDLLGFLASVRSQ